MDAESAVLQAHACASNDKARSGGNNNITITTAVQQQRTNSELQVHQTVHTGPSIVRQLIIKGNNFSPQLLAGQLKRKNSGN